MDALQHLYKITKQMSHLFRQKITSENRDQMMMEMNQLLDEREKVFKQLQPPYTASDRKMGQKILRLNEEVEKKMQKVFHELRNELQIVKKHKKSNQSYLNPFKDTQNVDGVLLDRKN